HCDGPGESRGAGDQHEATRAPILPCIAVLHNILLPRFVRGLWGWPACRAFSDRPQRPIRCELIADHLTTGARFSALEAWGPKNAQAKPEAGHFVAGVIAFGHGMQR